MTLTDDTTGPAVCRPGTGGACGDADPGIATPILSPLLRRAAIRAAHRLVDRLTDELVDRVLDAASLRVLGPR